MERFIEACFHHSRAVISILILLVLMGLSTYLVIPRESAPDVKIPIIYIQLHLEGISPEDAERLLIKPVETKVRSIEGIKEMKSNAYQSGANIILEFRAGFNADKARLDVREKVDDAKSNLPSDAKEPVIKEVNVSLFPVLAVHLSGHVPNRTLYQLAENIRDTVEARIPSVLEAAIVGNREDVVEIVIDPEKLDGYGLSTQETLSIIRRNNVLVSAGAIDTGKGKFSIKVPGLIENVEDLANFPLITSGDSVVRIQDVATVRRTYKDPTGYARLNGTPSVSVEISKRTGENILETVEAVQRVISDLSKEWPKSVKISFTQDESTRIKTQISDLQNNLIAAVLLVMIVMVLSMGWRSSLLVSISIPGAFLIGVLVIGFLGYTLNIVVLFSLILAVGLLVDGAIIVVEYADRQMVCGKSKREAYLEASKYMAWPVFSSTATILVVFLPLLFWPGVVGQFMKFLPITLIATLAASFFMAMVFIPTIGSLVGKVSTSIGNEISRNIELVEAGPLKNLTGLTRKYVDYLSISLNHPFKTIGGVIVLIVFTQQLYYHFGKGIEFFPDIEPDTAVIKIRARGNLSVQEKDNIVQTVEKKVLGIPGIKTAYSNTDIRQGGGGKSMGAPLQEDVIGLITLEFDDWQKREKVDVILRELDKKLKHIQGIFIEFQKNKPGPSTDKPIQIQLSSDNPQLLEDARLKILQHLKSMKGLTNIEDDKPIPGIEWVYRVDRAQALKFGTDISLIGSLIKLATNGMKVDVYRPNDVRDEVDILARYPEKYRTLDRLASLKIQTPHGLVPLTTFVKETTEPKFDTLKRSDGKRAYLIKADVEHGILADEKIKLINQWLKKNPLSPKVSALFKGEEEDKKETGVFLLKSFVVAICAIAVILTIQFNSFFNMALVLSSITFSTIGMFFGLLVTNQAFSIVMCGIGTIALAGIIVNNNIILIDTFERIKGQYSDVKEALLRTGAQRLRPVILTKLTTALGLLPIQLGLDIGFIERHIQHGGPSTQWWIQLATCLIFGILFASPLTLFVTPCALLLREKYKRRK